MQVVVIVFIVVLIVYFLGTEGLKYYFDAKVRAFYAVGLYDDCIEMLDKPLARIVMSTFKQYYLRFIVYEASGNTFAANEMLGHLLRMRSSGKRRASLLVAAFNFYAKSDNKKRAKDMLGQLERQGGVSAAQIEDCKLTYGILFSRRYDQIEPMEKLVSAASPEVRSKLYFLLAKQYENAGNKKKAAYYTGLLNELTAARRPPTPPSQKAEDGSQANEGDSGSASGKQN